MKNISLAPFEHHGTIACQIQIRIITSSYQKLLYRLFSFAVKKKPINTPITPPGTPPNQSPKKPQTAIRTIQIKHPINIPLHPALDFFLI